jgi:hypothetical protein
LSYENIIGKPYMFSSSRLPDVLWHLPAIILPDKERAPVQPETEDDMAGNVEHPDLFGVGRFEAAMPAPMPGWSRNHPAPTVIMPTASAGANVGADAQSGRENTRRAPA